MCGPLAGHHWGRRNGGGGVCLLTQLSPKSQDSVHKPGGWISRAGGIIGVDLERSEFCSCTDHMSDACKQMLPIISLIIPTSKRLV